MFNETGAEGNENTNKFYSGIYKVDKTKTFTEVLKIMALKKMSFTENFTLKEGKYGRKVEFENKGDFFVGVFSNVEEEVGKYKSKVWEATNSEGKRAIWGCHKIDECLDEIEFPFIAHITFHGEFPKASGCGVVKDFSILVKKLPKDFDIQNDEMDVSELRKENDNLL